MSAATFVVRLAAATLPKNLRARYREQWLADLRDAEEAGVRSSEIALGALAFSATLARPILPGLRTPDAAGIERRARLAGALALSCALLALSLYGRVALGAVTSNAVRDFIVFLAVALLALYFMVALLAAAVIVSITHGIPSRVRTAVWLLVGTSTAPLTQALIDGLLVNQDGPELWLIVSHVAGYATGTVVAAIAMRLLWLAIPRSGATAPRWSVALASSLVVAIGALGIVLGAVAWAARTPIVFSWLPGYSVTSDANGNLVRTSIPTTRAMYEEWLALKEHFEWLVAANLVGLGAVVIVLTVAVIVISRRARIQPAALAAAAIAVLIIANAGFWSWLQFAPTSPPASPELLQLTGQLLLVAIALVGVGEVRLARRPRAAAHAHS